MTTRLAHPDTMDPRNNDHYWPHNPPSEPVLCLTCENEVKEDGDSCWECQVSAAEYAPNEEKAALAHYLSTNVTTISQ